MDVGTAYVGQTVDGWLFSTPVHLGSAVVTAAGAATFTIPTGVPAGTHRLVVTDADGNVIGWTTIEILGLPATGGELPLGVFGAGALLLAAGAVLLIARRRALHV